MGVKNTFIFRKKRHISCKKNVFVWQPTVMAAMWIFLNRKVLYHFSLSKVIPKKIKFNIEYLISKHDWYTNIKYSVFRVKYILPNWKISIIEEIFSFKLPPCIKTNTLPINLNKKIKTMKISLFWHMINKYVFSRSRWSQGKGWSKHGLLKWSYIF